MNILKNGLAIVLGVVAGSLINMALVVFGSSVVPPPEGVDVMDADSIKASIHLFGPQHFVVPFVAHALGTFTGALVAFLVAGSYRKIFALIIGAFFLVGGIAASTMIPAPVWFIVLDLVGAYLPMAWLGTLIGGRIKPESA